MINLERMTTEYVPDEDRISLTAKVQGGGTARVWLTRRLSDRLFAALGQAVHPRHRDPTYAEIVGEIAQAKAERSHEPQTPVKVAAPDHEWLVRKIDIRTTGAGTLLEFHGAQDQCARLAMPVDVVRQWLAIARRVYGVAEWSATARPDSAQPAQPRRDSSVVLH